MSLKTTTTPAYEEYSDFADYDGNKIKLSAPWFEYVRKLENIFLYDEDISIIKDTDGNEIKLYVDNNDKYQALINLLPDKKEFGNVTLKINIVPANENAEKDKRYYLKKLFKGNNAVTEIADITMGTNKMTFIEFEKEVIQYYNDNLADLHGNRTTLMQDIAREIFIDDEETVPVQFCTRNY